MTEIEFSEDDLTRTLDLADGHLEEAENVIWNTSKEADSEEVTVALEELSRDIWDIQHKISDLQREHE